MSCPLPVTPGVHSCRPVVWSCRGTCNQGEGHLTNSKSLAPASPRMGIPSRLKDENKGPEAMSQIERNTGQEEGS